MGRNGKKYQIEMADLGHQIFDPLWMWPHGPFHNKGDTLNFRRKKAYAWLRQVTGHEDEFHWGQVGKAKLHAAIEAVTNLRKEHGIEAKGSYYDVYGIREEYGDSPKQSV